MKKHELIYGTYNPAKFDSMVHTIDRLDVHLIRLSDVSSHLEPADENGNNPLSNAVQKAQNYYAQIKRPIFSCDSGLYFEGVKDAMQPGVNIRRVGGVRLSDAQMMQHYMTLAASQGGKLTAYYKNAICLILDDETIIKYDGSDLHSEKFYMVDTPHHIVNEGFPLDSISMDIQSKAYYYDIKAAKMDKYTELNGFYTFFKNALNQ